MSKITLVNNLTLDGVMQAPARPDEDTRDGFTHGGWALPYQDPTLGSLLGRRMGGDPDGGLLLGHRTYDDFYAVSPNRTDNPFTEVLTNKQKYVPSRSATTTLPWANSTLLVGDAAETVAKLKAELTVDLVLLGSGELVRTLMRENLIDEYVLLIHPLVLGSGQRMFTDGIDLGALRLVDSATSATGVLIATYQPAETAH